MDLLKSGVSIVQLTERQSRTGGTYVFPLNIPSVQLSLYRIVFEKHFRTVDQLTKELLHFYKRGKHKIGV